MPTASPTDRIGFSERASPAFVSRRILVAPTGTARGRTSEGRPAELMIDHDIQGVKGPLGETMPFGGEGPRRNSEITGEVDQAQQRRDAERTRPTRRAVNVKNASLRVEGHRSRMSAIFSGDIHFCYFLGYRNTAWAVMVDAAASFTPFGSFGTTNWTVRVSPGSITTWSKNAGIGWFCAPGMARHAASSAGSILRVKEIDAFVGSRLCSSTSTTVSPFGFA
jgi:hypothetical protein